MKKFFLICFFTNFVFGIAQEKKISFAKEIDYKLVEKNAPLGVLKTYASNNNEFLTTISAKNYPMYFFTDGLGTTSVGININNRLYGSSLLSSVMYDFEAYGYGEKDEYILESKKLDTKETILGLSCSHYLINYKSKNEESKNQEEVKLCIDDKSSYNNFPVLNGILNFFDKRSKFKNSGLSGLILKGGPEKTYDKEYFVATSLKDSKDFVYFDHKKAMTDLQRKQDSTLLEYKKREAEYAYTDSAAVADPVAVTIDSVAAAADPYSEDYSYYDIPEYISEYKKDQNDNGNLAIYSMPSPTLWKGLPKHCKNFEKDLPEFNNKELKGHLENYVGQMCDMYLTQTSSHSVGIKITLDKIRHEVLYLNEIQEKLDKSDKKKLNNYLKNLD